jgi:hypothetical protein
MLWFLAPFVIAALAIIASFQHVRWSSSDDVTACKANPAWPLEDIRTHQLVVPDATTGTERTLTVEKLSSHPPVFRIKNFLTPAECATLRRLAVDRGLREGYVDSDDGLGLGLDGKKKKMGIFDVNEDGRLSIHELIRMVDDFFESHVSEDDIRSMLATIDLSLDEQGTVSINDFIRSDTAAMRRYFLLLIKENPSKRSRHSEMAWLDSRTIEDTDQEGLSLIVMESIRQRVAMLTRLPQHVVHPAMEMQVVHYEPNTSSGDGTNDGDDHRSGGHYTAHFDSLPPSSQPCCHITNRRSPCRTCRMATVLYSLSDVAAGGHTAFPLAEDGHGENSNRRRHTAETVEDWRMSSASRESSYCAEDGPGLRIQPELGQAILWYNHDIRHLKEGAAGSDTTSSALLGDLDRSTIHAGCPSWENQPSPAGQEMPWNASGKWIANHWIEASNIPGEDEEHYFKITGNR